MISSQRPWPLDHEASPKALFLNKQNNAHRLVILLRYLIADYAAPSIGFACVHVDCFVTCKPVAILLRLEIRDLEFYSNLRCVIFLPERCDMHMSGHLAL